MVYIGSNMLQQGHQSSVGAITRLGKAFHALLALRRADAGQPDHFTVAVLAVVGQVEDLVHAGPVGSVGAAKGSADVAGRRGVQVGGQGLVAHQQGGGGVVLMVLRGVDRAEGVPAQLEIVGV